MKSNCPTRREVEDARYRRVPARRCQAPRRGTRRRPWSMCTCDRSMPTVRASGCVGRKRDQVARSRTDRFRAPWRGPRRADSIRTPATAASCPVPLWGVRTIRTALRHRALHAGRRPATAALAPDPVPWHSHCLKVVYGVRLDGIGADDDEFKALGRHCFGPCEYAVTAHVEPGCKSARARLHHC